MRGALRMKLKKVFLFLLIPLMVFSQGYVSYIGKLTSQKLKNGSVLKFENVSINLPVLIGGLIGAEILPPSVCDFLKKFRINSMQPLQIKEIAFYFRNQTRTVEISGAKNNFIEWRKISFVTSPEGEKVEIDRLTLNSPILNTLNLEPIHIESLIFENSQKGKYLKVFHVGVFKGQIEKLVVDLNENPIVDIEGVRDLSLEEALKLAKFLNPNLGIDVKGNLSLESLEVKTHPSLVLGAKNLNLLQDEGEVELSKLVYTEGRGIYLEGIIDNFLITNNGQEIYINGNFERSKHILTNKFNLSVELPNLIADLNGYFSVKRKYTDLLLKEVHLELLKTEKEKADKEPQKVPFNPEQVKVTLPTLPFNVKVQIEKLAVEPSSIEIPKVKLRKQIVANNIYLEYTDGVYSSHADICFNDIYLNADTKGNLSFLLLTINNPLSSVLGCFVKDIDVPKLKDIFFNGYISLYLLGSITDGKLSTLKGLYELSLLKGYFFISDSFTLEGFLGGFYNTMSSILKFVGVNYQEVNYNLYSAGNMFINGDTLGFTSKTYLMVEKPIAINFGGFAGGRYIFGSQRGYLNLKGYTKLPFKSLRISKILPLGGKSKKRPF
jgi:hypothetical protein